jgi:uncharacterized repeat protein (TIGR01451 family)
LQNTCGANEACSGGTCNFLPQCSDGIDNDSDGATDYPADFSCESATDNDEFNLKSQCQDGIDNDGDNLIDHPQDPGCVNKQDNSESNGTVVCSSNSQCGTDGFVGGNFCQGNSVYRNYQTYTCNNPGTTSSTCSSSTVAQQQNACNSNQTCSNGTCSTNLTVSCNATPNPASAGQQVTFSATVAGGTGNYTYSWSGACTGSNTNCSTTLNQGNHTVSLTVTSGSQTQNATCSVPVNAVTCTTNSQCGTDGLTGGNFCQGNSVYRNYTTYTCNNPGTSNSYCSNSTAAQLQNSCGSNQTCSAGSCSNAQSHITVISPNGGEVWRFNETRRITWTSSGVNRVAIYIYNDTISGSGSTNYLDPAQTSTSVPASQGYFDWTILQNWLPHPVAPGNENRYKISIIDIDNVNQLNRASDSSDNYFTITGNTNIACSTNSQCGTNGFVGGNFCQGNSVYRNYTTYTCNNPGTRDSFCSNNTQAQLQSTCSSGQTCSNGTCSTINTCTSNSYQQCVGNAVYWFNSCGQQQSIIQTCNSNQVCQNNACVNQAQVSLSTITRVRNLSTGNLAWSQSVNAAPSDTLQYSITIQNISSTTATNVTIKETLPSRLIYANNLTVDGILNNGNILSGINLGNLAPGQTKTVIYQVQVAPANNFSFGTTSLLNAVTVIADSGISVSSNAPVFVTRATVGGATTISTGITSFFAESVVLPLGILLAGLWVSRKHLLPKKSIA